MFFILLTLTIDRHKEINTLVANINKAVQEVVDDMTKNPKVKHKIGASDLDPWPRDGVSGQYCGQYCGPVSTGRYPDPKQPDLQFFKPHSLVPLTTTN